VKGALHFIVDKLIISIMLTASIFCALFIIDDIEFEDYRDIIAAIAETGEYPHFLAEHAQRYEAYQARYAF
jgi:hypothetical protein